jgi:hypothetical protein
VVVAGGDPRKRVAHGVRHHRHSLLLWRHLEANSKICSPLCIYCMLLMKSCTS